jgi:hypothetical protein
MDFFESRKLLPLLSLHAIFPDVPICTGRATGWFAKGAEIDYLTLTKCYSKVAHAFLYTLIHFFWSLTAQVVAILPSSIFPNVPIYALYDKMAGWFTKGLISPNLPSIWFTPR